VTKDINPMQIQSALITIVFQLLQKLREAGIFEDGKELRAFLQEAADANRAEYNPVNQGAADFIESFMMEHPILREGE
jgi:hypothetical protein